MEVLFNGDLIFPASTLDMYSIQKKKKLFASKIGVPFYLFW